MLLTVVEERRVQYSALTDNDAVVAVSINYFRAIENRMRVLPNTKTAAAVVGTSPIKKFLVERDSQRGATVPESGCIHLVRLFVRSKKY